jgi:LTXXQ motif family protein
MFAFIALGLCLVEGICSVVYQAGFIDAAAYKTGTRRLHSHVAMGTDAARYAGAGYRQLQNKPHHQMENQMKRVTKLAIGAVTAVTLGLATAAVNAHPYGDGPGWGMGQGPGYGPGAGMGPMMGRGHMGYGPMGRGMGPQGWGNPEAAAEWRLSSLKSDLKITAAQEPAWKVYADQTKQQAEAMQKLMASVQGSAQATAPERLELRNQVMKQRQEQMAKRTAAFKDLYAVLSPEQKALADQRVGFGMMGGRGMAFNRPGW